MSALGWTILVLCLVALAVVAAVFIQRRGRGGTSSHALRRRFGPEYDRAVEQEGDRHTAERKLAEIARRRDELDIRPLEAGERANYVARWEGLQARFVDDPADATRQADRLIADVMRARGYPEARFPERVELISADRPEAAGTYRQARAGAASQAGSQDTEDLRSAFVRYRDLFTWLVDGFETPRTERPQAEQPEADRPEADGRGRRPALSGPGRHSR